MYCSADIDNTSVCQYVVACSAVACLDLCFHVCTQYVLLNAPVRPLDVSFCMSYVGHALYVGNCGYLCSCLFNCFSTCSRILSLLFASHFRPFLKNHDFPTRFRLCCVPRPLLWQTISVITFFFLGLVEHGSGLAGSTCWKPNIHPLNAQFWFCSWSVSEWWWWTFGKVYLDIVEAIIYLKIQGDAKCVCRDCVVLAHKTAVGIDRRELSLCLWSLIVGEECAINAMRYLLFSTCAFGNLSFTYFSSQSTQSVEIWRSTLPLLDKRMSTQSEEASNVHDFFRWMYFLPFCGLSLMVFEWTYGATIFVPGKLAKNVFPYSQSWNTWCDNGWYMFKKCTVGNVKVWTRSSWKRDFVQRSWYSGLGVLVGNIFSSNINRNLGSTLVQFG